MRKLLRPILLVCAAAAALIAAPETAFEYAPDGQVRFPADYRQWVYLSSGVGMTYGPVGQMGRMGPPMFDNVFVNPESYRAFLKTGRWPDKTMFVLEIRTSESHASINKDGHFQTDVMGIEAEVKDASAKTGEWTFYSFDARKPSAGTIGKAFGRDASCYACHGTNTAVENTFVQFYPELYDVAVKRGTLNSKFKALPVTVMKMVELIESEGWKPAAAALDAAAAQSPDASVLDAGNLSMLAGHLTAEKHPADAASVMLWTAGKYPRSAEIANGLGGAYLAAGNKEGARTATRRAIELAPADTSLTPEQRETVIANAKARLAKL
jgi:Cytochrome P460